MLLHNEMHRLFTWLVAGLLASASAGCRDEASRERRAPPSVVPADPATAGGAAREGQATTDVVSGDGRKVSIDNFTFRPEILEIAAGTKVVWVNGDDVPHTVRSTEDLFRSGTLDTDDVYEHVFSDPGTYEYYCGVHRHMTGKIVVK
jgi:plastocyanin